MLSHGNSMAFYYNTKVLIDETIRDAASLLSSIAKYLRSTPDRELEIFAETLKELPSERLENAMCGKYSTAVRTTGERDVWIICHNLILSLQPLNNMYLIDLCFLDLFIHNNEGWRTLSDALREIGVTLKAAIYRVHRNVLLVPSKNAIKYRPHVLNKEDESAEILAKYIRENRPCRIDIGSALTVVLAKDYHREKIFLRRHRIPSHKDTYAWTSWKQLETDNLL